MLSTRDWQRAQTWNFMGSWCTHHADEMLTDPLGNSRLLAFEATRNKHR
jgi:hypothetical protein